MDHQSALCRQNSFIRCIRGYQLKMKFPARRSNTFRDILRASYFSYQSDFFQSALRRSAANDKIFKLFFLHPFLASTIYNNTIKNKFDIG